jgi:death-on-curing protein
LIHLERHHVEELNRQMASATGCRAEVVLPEALDYALVRSRLAAGGRPAEEAPLAAAAALLHAIVNGQPFVDGNKRTAWLAARLLLGLNGLDVKHTPTEAAAMTRAVAVSGWTTERVLEWFRPRVG